MKQYLDLLRTIKEKGTHKPAARAGMPGTQSLFGYQFRHDLSEGFPLLTTKKMFWKGIVVELLWFLRGDTNIKYLLDNGVNIWNEDAYNYYLKRGGSTLTFENFISRIKEGDTGWDRDGYKLGDCGYQYGKVWRDWDSEEQDIEGDVYSSYSHKGIDQITNVINSLKTSPEGRRHIVTAWDPAHDQDLALTWCHALFQFNCRPLNYDQRFAIFRERFPYHVNDPDYTPVAEGRMTVEEHLDHNLTVTYNIPKYALDCQMYQRSADVVLGVPFNIASYALLTHIIAKICNMIPGDLIISYGDVHIYENHKEAVEEQLSREPRELPTLTLSEDINWKHALEENFAGLDTGHFRLEGYDPYPRIEAELSTGLIK